MLTLLTRRSVTLMPLGRACLRHQSTSPGPNEELIQTLTHYMEEEKASASPNSYKVRAYSKAISTIGQLPEQVRSVDQVRHLEGIGVRIAKRIDAYLAGTSYVRGWFTSGSVHNFIPLRLQEQPTPSSRSGKPKNSDDSLQGDTEKKPRKTLDELRRKQVVSLLSSISGIGPSKANALYDAGCRSLQDLEEPKFSQMLGRPQRIYARYMISPDRCIAHEQASAVHDFVMQNISSKFTILLGGDFRRGAASAQRITLIVLHPQAAGIFPPEGSPDTDSTIKQRAKYHYIPAPFTSHTQVKVKSNSPPDTTMFSTEIISPLECRGLVASAVSVGIQKWDGIIRVPERTESATEGDGWQTRAERIQAVQKREGQFFSAEIYYVPQQCAGAALIALTGDLEFNLAIRRAASQLGFRLNEYGLWRWRGMATTTGVDEVEHHQSIEERGGYWELVASEKEEDIFEAIGMEWVAPERRNFVNLRSRSRKRETGENV